MQIEIFPTNSACPAGCNHCPMSRRPGAPNNAPVNEEVLKSFQLLEGKILKAGGRYNFIYAGPFRSLANHMSALINHPEILDELKFSFDPKDTAKFDEQVALLDTQIKSLLLDFPKLSLKEVIATIYPKNHYRVSLKEKQFIVDLFKSMLNFRFLDKKPALMVELHANMVSWKEFVEHLPAFEKNDSKLYEELFTKLAGGEIPDLFNKKFTLMRWLGLTYISNLALLVSSEGVTRKFYVDNRIISPQEYAKTISRQSIAIHQGKTILGDNSLCEDPVFSFAPEGVMVMHSSIYITNPVIWISHQEFRELLEEYGTSKERLGIMAKMIIETNVKFLESEGSYISPKRAMSKFALMRKSEQKILA